MRLRKVSYTVEHMYTAPRASTYSIAFTQGRVLVVNGHRIDASGFGRPDTIKVYRDLDDKGTLLVLTVDNRYESVGLGVYHVDATHDVATRKEEWSETKRREFLEPLREEFLSQLNGDHDAFVDLFGRTPKMTFDFLRGLAPHTMARRLKRYIDETS